jgi:rare lipoprotein A (peptidoglycan hydrolase)/cell division protein FtsN
MNEKAVRNALLGTLVIGVFTGCSTAPPRPSQEAAISPDTAIRTAPDEVVPRQEPPSLTGNEPSYVVFGRRYYVMGSSEGYRQRGIASWYGPGFHGRRTSSGNIYNMYGISAAHKNLPIPSYARVTHLGNGRSIVVRIDDRGPFVGDRLIDLSYGAAAKLGMIGGGTALVEIEALAPYQYLPGFEPGQAIAGAHQPGSVNSSRVASSWNAQPPGVAGPNIQPAVGTTPKAVSANAGEPVGPADRDAFSFSSQLAGSGQRTASAASQPTAATRLTTALASSTQPTQLKSWRVTPAATRSSTLEADLNKAFAAPPQPVRNSSQGVTLVTVGQPPRVVSPPAVSTGQPMAETAPLRVTATASESAGPAGRNAVAFSTQLAGPARETPVTAGQPARTSGQTLATASTPQATSLTSPKVTPAPTGQPLVTPAPTGQPLETGPKVASVVAPPAGTREQTAAVTAPLPTVNSLTSPKVTPAPTGQPLETGPKVASVVAPPGDTRGQTVAVTAPLPTVNRVLQNFSLIAKAEASEYPVPAATSSRTGDAASSETAAHLADASDKSPPAPAMPVNRAARSTAATGATRAPVTTRASAPAATTVAATARPASNDHASAAAKPITRVAVADKVGARTVAQAAPRQQQPAAAVDTTNHLYLQVGAFVQRGSAEQLRNRLVKALGYSVRIDPGRNNLHTVRVGPLNDPVEATRLKERLAGLGIITPHVVFD